MPKRPACTYRDWERVIKTDGDDNTLFIQKEYNCTSGTQPYIQDVCSFFDFDWLFLSDRDCKIEDKWTAKDWQDLPSSHPCK